jgi:hypothetical protein
MSEKINKAKGVLLTALERLDKDVQLIGGDPDRVDLIVVFEVGREQENGNWISASGWVSTSGPKWTHKDLLLRAAESSMDEATIEEDES